MDSKLDRPVQATESPLNQGEEKYMEKDLNVQMLGLFRSSIRTRVPE